MADSFLPPVVATLLLDIKEFSTGIDEAGKKMKGLEDSGGASFTKLGKWASVAGVAVVAAGVKMASDFEAQMTRLYTAAGAPEQAVKNATDQVLKLGTSVGFSGTQIAEALYHPVSAGLDLATSLQAVKYAAQEAQISGASLEDTTYALSSVMKAFNQDASQAHDTMALLNSIVGQGDMRFQDFNTSVKNWAPTAAAMGISIQSMGAALAYLTDRGSSAEEAATRVTMGLTMMATPSKQAASILVGLGVASDDVTASSDAMTAVLKKAGITQNALAQDLAKPDGIYVALTHLKSALKDAGVEGTEADSALAKIFGGGRSDKAILSLLQNLDGLKTKFDDIGAGAKSFDTAWAETQKTFAFQMKQVGASVENFAIKLGTVLIPVIQSVLGFFTRYKLAADALAVAIGAVLFAAMLKFAQTATTAVLTSIGKIITGFRGMGTAAETAAKETEGASAATGGLAAKLGSAIPVIGGLAIGASALGSYLDHVAAKSDKAGASVDQLTSALVNNDTSVLGAGDSTAQLADLMQSLGASVQAGTSPMAEYGIAIAETGQKLGDATKTTKNYDGALAAMVSNGQADKAKTVIDQIAAATDAHGKAMINTAKDFPQYFAALDAQKAQASLAAGATSDATAATDANGNAAQDAAGQTANYASALDAVPAIAVATADAETNLSGKTQQVADALKAANQAAQDVSDALDYLSGRSVDAEQASIKFKDDLDKLKDSIDKNGKSLNDNSQAGRNNISTMLQMIKDAEDHGKKVADQTGSVQKGTQAFKDDIEALKKHADELGYNKQQVQNLIDEYAKVPVLDLKVDFSQLSAAQQALANLNAAAGSPIGRGGSRVQSHAAGGAITGAGSATSDSILSWVSNGEYVESAAAVSRAGMSVMNALNSGNLAGAYAALGSRLGTAPAAAPVGRAPSSSYGTGATNTAPVIEIYLDGKRISGAFRAQVLQYDSRNSKNGLALAGTGFS